jgi:FkbM family methyltransferase
MKRTLSGAQDSMLRESSPFGALKPSAFQERVRRFAHRLPDNYVARKLSSLLLGPAGAKAGRAFDVEVFGSQKARLHPYDNICERRVYLTPQHWDPKERALLGEAIAAHTEETFCFADVGANVGLYTLFARAEALKSGKRLCAALIEPDPELRARLAFNLSVSGAEGECVVLPYAATMTDGPVRFAADARSRGLSRIAVNGTIEVEGRTLARMLRDAGCSRIDAMKVDVEGSEYEALQPLFADGAQALMPRLLILETSHDDPARSALGLALGAQYRVVYRNRLNAVLVREIVRRQ